MIVAELFAKLGLTPDKKSWEKGSDLIKGMHSALAAFVGFKAFQSIAGWVQDTVHAGDEAVKTAQKLGITSDAVQELNYAAGQSGTSGEALTAALGKLAGGMQEVAKTGKGPVAEAFSALGISMQQLKGEGLDQNLELIAKQMAAMPDGAKKTALAMKLFGKSGKDLIPLLNSGQEGIAALRNEAHDLGYVIEGESAKGMEEFGDNVDRVKTVLIGMRNQAVSALMPALKHLVEGMLEWVKANREVIKNTISGAVQVVITVVKGLGVAVRVVGAVLSWFAEHAEVARAVMIALGLVVAATAASAIASWVAAAAVFALPIAAIAALILILQDVWESFLTGKGIAVSVVGGIGKVLGALWRKIKSDFNAVGNIFKTIGRGIKEFFIGVVNFIIDKIDTVIDGINWALRQANKLPGVDFGQVGKIGQIKGDGPSAAVAPVNTNQGPVRAMQGASVSNKYGDINITTQPGQDPEAVAAVVRRELSVHWSDRMNEALAGTGAA